jgi:hypothetical protein
MYAVFSLVGLGYDSFLASLVIGSYALTWRDRFRFAIAFGCCDAAAVLMASILPHRLPGPPAVAIYLACVFVLAVAARTSRTVLYALPLLLSMDNLFSRAPASMAPVLGASSAVMALLGLSLAVWGREESMLSEAEV